MWRRAADIWRSTLKSKALTRYLLLTNVVSGVVVDASGDFIVQRGIEGASSYDYSRTSRMALVGVSLTVPDHYWYKYLDRRLPSRNARVILLKVVLDCVIMGPVNIVLFYLGEATIISPPSPTPSVKPMWDRMNVLIYLKCASTSSLKLMILCTLCKL